MEVYLKQSTRFELLASQLQIHGAKSTLGELDFLLYDKKFETPIHLEMACKFYLLDTSSEEHTLWIGPNRRDSLPKKYEKWKTRQFPMLYHEITQKMLADLIPYTVESFQQRCYLRAFLFIPEALDPRSLTPSEQCSLVGTYRGKEALNELDPNAYYALPPKRHWLLPPPLYPDWIPQKEAQPKIAEAIARERAVLVYEKKGSDIKQFFIVWWI